jgi:hypothetical protein
MTKNNRVLGIYSWMLFWKLVKKFTGTQNGGPFIKGRSAVAAFFRSLTGCYIENCLIAFKLSPCIMAAAGRMAGKAV